MVLFLFLNKLVSNQNILTKDDLLFEKSLYIQDDFQDLSLIIYSQNQQFVETSLLEFVPFLFGLVLYSFFLLFLAYFFQHTAFFSSSFHSKQPLRKKNQRHSYAFLWKLLQETYILENHLHVLYALLAHYLIALQFQNQ